MLLRSMYVSGIRGGVIVLVFICVSVFEILYGLNYVGVVNPWYPK